MQFRETFFVHSKNRVIYTCAVGVEMLSLLLWQTSTAVFLTIGGVECLNVGAEQEQVDVELTEFHFSK